MNYDDNIHNNIIDDIKFTSGDNNVKLIRIINGPFPIIDHGCVLYLILLKILFYNQQYDTLLSLFGAGANDEETCVAVMMKVKSYKSDAHTMFNLNANATFSIIMTPHSLSLSYPSLSNGNIHDEETSDVVIMRTLSYKPNLNKNTLSFNDNNTAGTIADTTPSIYVCNFNTNFNTIQTIATDIIIKRAVFHYYPIRLVNPFFHIIDHGSILCLIFLQIQLHNQQDVLSLLDNNGNTVGAIDNITSTLVAHEAIMNKK